MRKKAREEIKNNFLLVVKEVLSSSDALCRNVDMVAEEHGILHRSDEDRCLLANVIIKKRTDLSKGIGFAANIPSAIPVLGVIGTTAFMSAVEFISLVRLQLEMCLEIAYVYGQEPDHDRLVEAFAIIGCYYDKTDVKCPDKAALKSGLKKAVKSYVKKGALLMVERLSMRIEFVALKRVLPRFIPFLGMPIAAGMNYRESLSVGKLAQMYYD